MTKNLFYTALGLMGLMGTLAIGVVNAETTISEPYGHIDYMLNENEPFEAKVITITDGTDTITILDRNLGAKKAGTGCDKNTNGGYCSYDETYGYHFQWGNNHGFKPGCDLSGSTYYCSDTIASGAVNLQVDATTISYNPASQEFYNSGVFYKGYSNWLTDNSKVDLWGGSTGGTDTITSTSSLNGDNWKVDESTVTNRQGPCPRGWHVPSIGELNKLVSMMTGSNNSEKITQLHSDLYIPFAGLRGYYDASVYYMGNYAYLWSSSPYSASNPYSRGLRLNVDGYLRMDDVDRADALSVRCFYDSYQPFTQSFTLSFTGVEGGSVSMGSIEVEEGSSISRDDEAGTVSISGTVVATGISDEGYAFSGWTTDCGATLTANCTFTGEFKPIPYTITYFGTGDDYTPSATGFTIKSDAITLTQPSREGYTFTGWSGTKLASLTQTVEIPAGSTGDRTYEANWEAIEYEIIYELNGGVNSPNNVTGYTIESNITFENATKDGYSFDGWFTDAQFTTGITAIPVGTTGEITIYAKWTENKKPSGGSSGGGGRSNKTSDTQDSSTSSQNDNKSSSGTEVKDLKGDTKDSSDKSSEGQEILSPSDSSFTKEQKDAYTFAHEKGITTMPTINEANMNGKLTRIAMAKMLSQYAMNVLGQKPANIVTPKFNDVSDKQDSDYDDGVTLAYQLGIMGQNMPNNKFRPDDEVTRAEFATALSRMAYGTSDGEYKGTGKYYIHHMEKLVKEGIITNDDPNMKELRGYVMIMLMRSTK